MTKIRIVLLVDARGTHVVGSKARDILLHPHSIHLLLLVAYYQEAFFKHFECG